VPASGIVLLLIGYDLAAFYRSLIFHSIAAALLDENASPNTTKDVE
jgi:hypothetical protein